MYVQVGRAITLLVAKPSTCFVWRIFTCETHGDSMKFVSYSNFVSWGGILMARAFAVVDTSEVESFCFLRCELQGLRLFLFNCTPFSDTWFMKVIKSSTIANEDLLDLGRLGGFSLIFGVIEPFVVFNRWLTKRVTSAMMMRQAIYWQMPFMV